MTQGWAVATGRHNGVTRGRRKRRLICPSSVHCSSLIRLLAQPDRCAPFSCAQCDVSFCASLFLALMNVFFFSPPPSTIMCPAPRFTLSHGCHILDHVPLARSLWPVSVPSPSSFHVNLCLFFSPIGSPAPTQKKTTTHRVCAGPFRLEIIECTVAPVAMEDSDHEVQSSSDERDSCPASPNRGRDHDADQVLATPCALPPHSATEPRCWAI